MSEENSRRARYDRQEKSLGVSDLIDKDTRAQGMRMTLDSEEGAPAPSNKEQGAMKHERREKEIPVSRTVCASKC